MGKRMKESLVFIGVLAIFTIGYLYRKNTSMEMSSLILENVEALSYPEFGIYDCFGIGSVDCPISRDKVEMVYEYYSLRH